MKNLLNKTFLATTVGVFMTLSYTANASVHVYDFVGGSCGWKTVINSGGGGYEYGSFISTKACAYNKMEVLIKPNGSYTKTYSN